jgi:DNA-binding NarL/FixJ family response regulator
MSKPEDPQKNIALTEALARTTILVVDDAPESLSFLHAALKSAGFTVLTALDGASALEQVARVLPDAILLDALMPGLDGFETCKAIKQLPGTAHVPVIFMTGLSESDDVIKGLQAGGVDYATKPIQPEALVERVRVHVRNARLLRGAQSVLRSTGRAILSVRENGQVQWQTPEALGLMRLAGLLPPNGTPELSARAPGSLGSPLPDEVRQWLPTLRVGQDLVWRSADQRHRVVLRCVAALGAREWLLGIETDPLLQATQWLSERHGLSQREVEVLYWVACGKSNRDIAEILQMQPRTVGKHLEHIFVKLGVENRAAATSFVMRFSTPSDATV